MKLVQPHLINQIIHDVNLPDGIKTKKTPATPNQILCCDKNEPPFNHSFHYHGIMGKLNFLAKSTQVDIKYATHQCAQFSLDP